MANWTTLKFKSFWGPEKWLLFQRPQACWPAPTPGLTTIIMPVPGEQTPSAGVHQHQAHEWNTDINAGRRLRHKTEIKIIISVTIDTTTRMERGLGKMPRSTEGLPLTHEDEFSLSV